MFKTGETVINKSNGERAKVVMILSNGTMYVKFGSDHYSVQVLIKNFKSV